MPTELPFDVRFTRLIDSGLLRDNPGAVGQTCLKTLIRIVENSFQADPMYQRIRESKLRGGAGLLTAAHGEETLVEIGMLRRVREFEAWWEFRTGRDAKNDKDTTDTERRKVALRILREHMAKAVERAEREAEAVRRAKCEDQERREQVLAQIEDDRLRRKDVHERQTQQRRQALNAAAAREEQQRQQQQLQQR
ncbi:hypothetical protein HDU86_004198 [Geranomyces michiganensis]|nr:hypothetical protein HDU86_004198 [Geranomyces michiganensis]